VIVFRDPETGARIGIAKERITTIVEKIDAEGNPDGTTLIEYDGKNETLKLVAKESFDESIALYEEGD
jgi:hypothetical protein